MLLLNVNTGTILAHYKGGNSYEALIILESNQDCTKGLSRLSRIKKGYSIKTYMAPRGGTFKSLPWVGV